MKKFILKLVLLSSPFLLAIGVELFVLPIDYFTFRTLEALVIKQFDNILPGKFYPNMTLIREEEGDLGHHTKYALKRTIEWTTDSYGYRKKGPSRPRYEVVIIGQSETFGGGLTQKEMLSEVLEDRLTLGVYPLAPTSVNTFLKERRFIRHPPEIVIVTCMGWGVFYLPPPKISLMKKGISNGTVQNMIEMIQENRRIQSVFVFLDRLYKMNMFRYLRATLRRMFSERQETALNLADTRFGPILFFQGAKANEDVPKEKLDQVVQTIKSYDDLFKSRGIRFIFLPIPEKENIFYESLGTQRPVFWEQLVARLKELGIGTVDVPRAFEEEYRKNSTLLYLPDDTHWNPRGVRLAADRTVKLIEGEGNE